MEGRKERKTFGMQQNITSSPSCGGKETKISCNYFFENESTHNDAFLFLIPIVIHVISVTNELFSNQFFAPSLSFLISEKIRSGL